MRGYTYLYVKYDRNKPNLPIAIGANARELADDLGRSAESVRSSIAHGCSTTYRVRLISDEEEEKIFQEAQSANV